MNGCYRIGYRRERNPANRFRGLRCCKQPGTHRLTAVAQDLCTRNGGKRRRLPCGGNSNLMVAFRFCKPRTGICLVPMRIKDRLKCTETGKALDLRLMDLQSILRIEKGRRVADI